MRWTLAGIVVGAVVGLGVVPAAAAPHSAAVSGSTASSSAVSSTRTVVLPTGDAVVLNTVASRTSVSVRAADRSGPAGQFLTESLGGHTYVLPGEVRPLLGTVLDPSLFDVTSLATAARSGRIPVTVTAPTASSIAIPGFTATSRSGSVTTGYLASSSAGALRQALVAAWRSAVAPGGVVPTSLFGGVTHLALTGAVKPVQPAYPQVTLIIKVRTAAGKPSPGGFIGLVNTDDPSKFVNFVFYLNGEARVSLPYGHYSGLTDDATFTETSYVDRIIPIADYTVSRNLQTMTFDASKATARPSVHTPHPADLSTLSLEFDRGTARGGIGLTYLYGPGATVYVAPTPTARYGQLHFLTTWSLAHAPASGPNYSYDLSFLTTGSVPARLSHTVTAADLATVQARYYGDRRHAALFVRTPFYPFQEAVFSEFSPLNTPTARTEYINDPPNAIWLDQLIAYPTDENPFGGIFLDGFRIYPAGSTRNVDWLRGPLAPATEAATEGDPQVYCPACRTAGQLSVFLVPVTDTTPGHVGDLDQIGSRPVANFVLYRNGVRVGGGPDLAGGLFPVPAAPATYRIHDTTNRSADDVSTSTSTSTDLTFRSAATGGAEPPNGWVCGIGAATKCTVLPLLHATVPLPTSLFDTLPVGSTTFDFTIARIQGAAPAVVTAATLSTSTDGTTFQPATVVARGNGVFQATIVNGPSRAGHGVTVRVTGADAAGSTISQTVTAAYQVASN